MYRSEIPELEIPRLKMYKDDSKKFYLAKDCAKRPRRSFCGFGVFDSAFEAYGLLRRLEKSVGVKEGTFNFPNLYETYFAAKQDPMLEVSMINHLMGELKRTFILHPRAPTETENYVLMDSDRNHTVLQPSDKSRSLNPVKVCMEGKKNIVVANVFDIPFDLKDLRYNPEDLSPETGFLTKLEPRGQYRICFKLYDPGLYAISLAWGDNEIYCIHKPEDDSRSIGLRVYSSLDVPGQLVDHTSDVPSFMMDKYPGLVREVEHLVRELKKQKPESSK